MRLGWRLLAAMAVGFLLVPALRADDAEKAVTTAKDEAVNSPAVPRAAGEATPAAPTPAPCSTIKTRKAKRQYPQG